jgi:hypothetical protein
MVRKSIRYIATALLAGVLATIAVATPASATGTPPLSCKLSANWTVDFSANYNIDTQYVSIDYTVMRSPGAIKQWRTLIYVESGGGRIVVWQDTSTSSAKLQRMDPDFIVARLYPSRKVWLRFEVWGGSGACHTEYQLVH